MDSTIHFAPLPQRRAGKRRLERTSLISVTALAGIPTFIRDNLGERTLSAVNRRIGIDLELVADENSFIPHTIMSAFVEETAKSAGLDHFGLLLAPTLTIARYGCWGHYVLGPETLAAAIERAIESVGFHSNGDKCVLSVRGGLCRLGYLSAARGQQGYNHIATAIVGEMFNLCRDYIGDHWRPVRIELDLPKPPNRELFEEIFECPVVFESAAPAILFRHENLVTRRRQRRATTLVTVEDVARARLERATMQRLPALVVEQIRLQLYAGSISIDAIARSLNTSVRTLQRELNREGASFRTLANEVRWRRGAELLRGTKESITSISIALGYSEPSHFTRAFRKAAGMAPGEFRRLEGSGNLQERFRPPTL